MARRRLRDAEALACEELPFTPLENLPAILSSSQSSSSSGRLIPEQEIASKRHAGHCAEDPSELPTSSPSRMLVKVRGKLLPEEELRGPLTGAPCVLYDAHSVFYPWFLGRERRCLELCELVPRDSDAARAGSSTTSSCGLTTGRVFVSGLLLRGRYSIFRLEDAKPLVGLVQNYQSSTTATTSSRSHDIFNYKPPSVLEQILRRCTPLWFWDTARTRFLTTLPFSLGLKRERILRSEEEVVIMAEASLERIPLPADDNEMERWASSPSSTSFNSCVRSRPLQHGGSNSQPRAFATCVVLRPPQGMLRSGSTMDDTKGSAQLMLSGSSARRDKSSSSSSCNTRAAGDDTASTSQEHNKRLRIVARNLRTSLLASWVCILIPTCLLDVAKGLVSSLVCLYAASSISSFLKRQESLGHDTEVEEQHQSCSESKNKNSGFFGAGGLLNFWQRSQPQPSSLHSSSSPRENNEEDDITRWLKARAVTFFMSNFDADELCQVWRRRGRSYVALGGVFYLSGFGLLAARHLALHGRRAASDVLKWVLAQAIGGSFLLAWLREEELRRKEHKFSLFRAAFGNNTTRNSQLPVIYDPSQPLKNSTVPPDSFGRSIATATPSPTTTSPWNVAPFDDHLNQSRGATGATTKAGLKFVSSVPPGGAGASTTTTSSTGGTGPNAHSNQVFSSSHDHAPTRDTDFLSAYSGSARGSLSGTSSFFDDAASSSGRTRLSWCTVNSDGEPDVLGGNGSGANSSSNIAAALMQDSSQDDDIDMGNAGDRASNLTRSKNHVPKVAVPAFQHFN
ncbi:unnamed protein product [Amoebophrya sp. A25]|nr:unnamed protein product [Amoebophrya sp. A25]|eukprot:GSA25T00023824001.1